MTSISTFARRAFTNRSIGVRLSLLVVLNSSLALTLAGFALFGYESFLQRGAASRELSAQAGIIAESSTAALSFTDKTAATQTLAALRGDSNVVEGVMYDRNNRPFSRYERAGSLTGFRIPQLRQTGVYFENGAVLVFQPVRLGGETIGTIFLKSEQRRTGTAPAIRRNCLPCSVAFPGIRIVAQFPNAENDYGADYRIVARRAVDFEWTRTTPCEPSGTQAARSEY